MTMDTWKAEYYPTEAGACPPEQAIDHSLLKWRGLRPDALEKHDLKVAGLSVYSGVSDRVQVLYIAGDTCALCHHYANLAKGKEKPACMKCPLASARGGITCDDTRGDESFSPYYAFIGAGDPEPMIKWLEQTKEKTNEK